MSAALAGCERVPAPAPWEIWRIDLNTPMDAEAVDALSPYEHARAQRFAFDVHRRRYVCAHVALRQLLSARAGVPMTDLQFGFGRYGKPYLCAPHASLAFNLSDSQDVALIAMSPRIEIGVDVEVLREVPDALDLARAHFTATEQAALAEAERAGARDRGFLTGWTRKEACLKAIGSGLSVGAHTFEAGLDAAPRRVGIPVGATTAWVEVQCLAAGDDCVAAIARCVEGAGA
jgi:4'-phosphopantetheinyl transferase